jgi:hypothetical protein
MREGKDHEEYILWKKRTGRLLREKKDKVEDEEYEAWRARMEDREGERGTTVAAPGYLAHKRSTHRKHLEGIGRSRPATGVLER